MTAQTALDYATNSLKLTQRDAMRLLAFSENASRERLLTYPNQEINFEKYQQIAFLRSEFWPIEYIIGKAEFCELEFIVNENVLIPREETEILVDLALGLIEKLNIKSVADVGTGSGAIACALSQKTNGVKIFASDVSENAISVAKLNAKSLGANVEFLLGDLLTPFTCQNIDLVVSNPPYIANDYKLDSYVLKEPHLALFGGANGDEILIRLIDAFVTNSAKALICEMGYDQLSYIQAYCDKINLKPIFYKDLAGFDRGFYIIKEEK